MPYSIPLTDAGRVIYDQRDRDLERAVIFLVDRIGPDQWVTRKKAIHDRFMSKLKAGRTPEEGISLRDRVDEFGWYLYLTETLIADPPAVDSEQANRAAPYLSAFGRKLEAIKAIDQVDLLLDRLTPALRDQDPDQALFELLVGASYIEDGWAVEALTTSSKKSPDFEIKRGTRKFEVECKRFARRSEYANKEREAWLRQWNPTGQWLFANKHSVILTVTFHVEVQKLAPNALLCVVRNSISDLLQGREIAQPEVSITAEAVNYSRIRSELMEAYVKQGSSRERELITGRHVRDGGFTSAIFGKQVTVGPATVAGNAYWDYIEYVNGAFWKCDAPASIDAKARGIMTRLSEATRQLSGRLRGIVHIGIESEDDAIELIRATKIKQTLARFDARGQPVDWIFIHYFRGESLPAGSWALDETFDWHGAESEFFRPLRTGFVVIPKDVPTREGHHFVDPVSEPRPESNFGSRIRKDLFE